MCGTNESTWWTSICAARSRVAGKSAKSVSERMSSKVNLNLLTPNDRVASEHGYRFPQRGEQCCRRWQVGGYFKKCSVGRKKTTPRDSTRSQPQVQVQIPSLPLCRKKATTLVQISDKEDL